MDDGDVGGGVLLLDCDRVADGCSAANTGAVADLLVPGTDALDEDDVLALELASVDLLLELYVGLDLCVRSVVVLDGFVLGCSDCELDCTDGGLGSVLEDDAEVTDVSGDLLDLCVEVHGDVGAVLDLLDGLSKELGNELSVLCVGEVGGESSEVVLALEDVNRDLLGGDVQSGGHTGDTSTDDGCGLGDGDLSSLERLKEACLCDGHPEEVLCLLGCCLGAVHVDPGALVTDVGHVVEVHVESTVPACFPEEGLVGPGGAGCDDDPVEVVVGDELGDLVEGVLCARVFGLFRDNNVRQGLCVLGDLGYVHDGTDVDTAVADPNTDPGLLSGDVLLSGVLLRLAGLPAGVVDDVGTGLGGCTGSLCDGGGDVLGCCECTGDVDSGPGGLEGVEDGGLGESVLVELDSENLCELLCSLGGLESDGQDDHVEGLGDTVVVLVGVVDDDLFGNGVFLEVGDTCTAVHVDAVLGLSADDVGLELLSVGPDVHEEDVLVDVSVLLGDHCLLGCVHTADRGAVLPPFLLVRPGTAALNPCDGLGSLGGLVVLVGYSPLVLDNGGRYGDVTVEGSCCTLEPLVLDGGDDVGDPSVSVLGCGLCVPDAESAGGDDGSDLDGLGLVSVIVVDGILSAGLCADTALAIEDHLTLGRVDQGFPGDSLSVGDVDSPPGGQSVVELIGDAPGGTFCDTVTASGTGLLVDVPGFLLQGDGEVSGLSLDLLDLGVGHESDVGVSSCIRHLRRQDTCGTVVGREGLVEHTHRSTDRGQPVHEVDMDVSVCKVQGCLNTGNSSANH